MAFVIDFERLAKADLREGETFMKLLGGAALQRWRARLYHTIRELEIAPERYPEAEEATKLGLDLRVAYSGKRPHVYRIVFRIEDHVVKILRVRHSSRDELAEDDL